MKKELVAAKRYADALRSGELHAARRQFEMTIDRDAPASFDSEKAEEFKERNRKYAIQSLANSIELLAGAGQLEDAVDLTTDLLAYDESEATIDGLRSQLERAGGLRVLDVVLAEYGLAGAEQENQ